MFAMIFLCVLFAALATAASYPTVPPFLPIRYSYGGYPKVMADINWGTPSQSPSIPTVIDLGSANYWVYGPKAIANYGSRGVFGQGPCNVTVKPVYNYPTSKTASKVKPANELGYAYGGNGKLVSAYGTINDTISFAGAAPPIVNRRVALSNFSISTQAAAANCAGKENLDYDKSILGISRFNNPTYPTSGPSFRQDLLETGMIETSSMSMWFDKNSGAANNTFRGTTLFGAVAEDKYSGKLTRVKLTPPDNSYVGYYIATPSLQLTTVKGKSVKASVSTDSKQCLIDSGTGNDMLPIDQDTFIKTMGLIEYGGFPAYDGPCDSIPRSAALNFTFAALNKDKSGKAQTVNVSVPLRNYARGNSDYLGNKNKCALSLDLSTYNNCIFGAPFSTALFLAVNDAKDQIAIAQGGVSQGVDKGPGGLGKVTVIKKGQDLPAI